MKILIHLMRMIISGFLMFLLIFAVGPITVEYFLPRSVEQILSQTIDQVEQMIDWRWSGIDRSEWNFLMFDTTPEHLTQILGSWERYEELRDSLLQEPNHKMWISSKIEDGQIVWYVYMTMMGMVTEIKEQVITITNDSDTISFYVLEQTQIITTESVRVFENIKIGDWLPYVHLMIKADQQPKAYTIVIEHY